MQYGRLRSIDPADVNVALLQCGTLEQCQFDYGHQSMTEIITHNQARFISWLLA